MKKPQPRDETFPFVVLLVLSFFIVWLIVADANPVVRTDNSEMAPAVATIADYFATNRAPTREPTRMPTLTPYVTEAPRPTATLTQREIVGDCTSETPSGKLCALAAPVQTPVPRSYPYCEDVVYLEYTDVFCIVSRESKMTGSEVQVE